MALQDCINRMEKAGTPVSPQQQAALQGFLDIGMTDEQAVRAVTLQAHQNVVDIAHRATNEGAVLAPVTNPVTDVVEFRARAMQKLLDQKNTLKEEMHGLNAKFRSIAKVKTHFRGLNREGVSTEVNNNIADDEVLMGLMVDMVFQNLPRPVNFPTSNDAVKLFDAFRDLEKQQDELSDRMVEIRADEDRIDEQVHVIFHGKKQTFYQSETPPKLTVRHNISMEKLAFSDKLGGLAMPSVAVTKAGASMSGFGEITLIGTFDLADPSKNPVFDADGYTVRFPTAEYGKASAKERDALWREVLPYTMMWEDSSELGYHMDRGLKGEGPGPGVLIWHMTESNAMKAKFLEEVHGEDLTPTREDAQPAFEWGWDPDIIAFFNEENVKALNYQWEDPRRRKMLRRAAEVVEKVAKRSFARRLGLPNGHARLESMWQASAMVNTDGTLPEFRFTQLMQDVKRKGTTRIDTDNVTEMLDSRLGKDNRQREFKDWVEGLVLPMVGEPRLKINGKWEPYNLENIVRKMKGKLRGTEFMGEQMTEGLMRALVSIRFKALEEMRERSEMAMDERALVDDLRVEAQEKMLTWLGLMGQFYVHQNEHGYVETMESDDDARRAIVRWATSKGISSAEDLRVELERKGFEEVPDWLMDEGVEAARTWLAVPVPYFEGKPQRAVKLDEFAGAVIPMDSPPETRALLKKRGIPYKEYQVGPNIDHQQMRTDAVTEFTQILNDQGERTLFQSELGLTSGLLTAAQTMPRESGTIKEMMETLRKQPNVRAQEIDSVGLEDWMEGLALRRAMAAGIAGEPYNDKTIITRDELTEFLKAGGVQLTETLYAGEHFLETPIHFNQEQAPDSAYEALDDFDYDTPFSDFSTEIYDLRDRDDPYGDNFRVWHDKEAGNTSVQVIETGEWLEVPGGMNNQDHTSAKIAIERHIYDSKKVPGSKGHVRWTQWTLDAPVRPMNLGSSAAFSFVAADVNHREIVLHVPEIEGYKYTMDDLTEIHHPDHDLTLPTQQREAVIRDSGLYHFIEARSPLPDTAESRGARETQRVQVFQIPKDPYTTIEQAKQYIIDEKPQIVLAYFAHLSAPHGANYTSHAFPEKNIVAWYRVSDRLGPNGERIFFVEEVQSDLHQAGMTEGYKYTEAQKTRSFARLEDITDKAIVMLDKLEIGDKDMYWPAKTLLTMFQDPEVWMEATGKDPFENLTKKQRALMNKWLEAKVKDDVIQKGGTTPNMPFKGDAWAELAMKRIIRLAVEGGYDQVAWTSGSQQLERYNIEEHLSRIEWDPRSEMLSTYDPEGDLIQEQHYTIESLGAVIGDERVLDIKRQMDAAERIYDVFAIDNRDEQPEGSIEIAPDDTFVDSRHKQLVVDGGGHVLIDENGEIHRQMSGDYMIYHSEDDALHERDNLIYEDNVPTLTAVDMQDEEGSGLKTRYDELLVNVTNRALRKLDKKAKVKRLGLQMEGGITVQGQRIERKGGGNLVPGTVDPGAFYVEGRDPSKPSDSGEMIQISPLFDTYVEAAEWHDNITKGFGNVQHGFDITPDIKEGAMEGQTLFQDRNRASITFDATNKAVIRMSESKDLSSFLHEMAHLYLEMMGDLAEMPDASDGLVDDYAKMLTYLGVNSRREIGRDQHELMARSVEAYLREGNSPTAELQPVFTDIMGWMTTVYKNLSQLLVGDEQLTDEIRGVFDRMVATDAQISASEDYMEYVALYGSAEEMGVTQRAFEVYRGAMSDSHNEALDKESKKMLKALLWSQQKWWKDELKKIAAEVRVEAEAEPVYKAMAMLQHGKKPNGEPYDGEPFKLDKADLIQRYGKAFIRRLPRPWVYTSEGGVDADYAAKALGYNSGNELIQALIAAPKMEAFIKAESTRRMQDLHPDPLNDPELAENAIRAVHNDKQGRVLAAEMKALRAEIKKDAAIVKATKQDIAEQDKQAREANKGQLPKRENLAHIKAAAAAVVGRMKIRDLNPNKYLQAERKAGRLAFEAMERKDYQEAYTQKLNQIRHYEAYRAATRAKVQAARDQKYLKGFEKKAKRQKMGKAGVLDEIDAILGTINFRKISGKQIDRENLKAELLPTILAGIADGSIVMSPETLATFQTPGGVNWQEMTVDEFAGVRDVIKQLEHRAKTQLDIIINGEKVVIQEAVDSVSESIVANHDVVLVPRGERNFGARVVKNLYEGVGHWLRSSSIARILDQSGFGAVTRNIIVPIRRAYTEKLYPRLHKASKDLADIWLTHYSKDEMAGLKKKREDSGLEKLSKADILALALNWGTETNRQAVLGGVMTDATGNKSPAYTEQDVAALLATLDARDWAFVQDMWRYQDTYYPEMAATEKRRRGIAPERVEGMTFEVNTSDGQTITVEGGYHPLRYNSDHGGKVSEKEFQDYYNRVTNGTYVSANTRAGATYERVKNHGKVVLLSLNTIEHNLREVIRDIAIGDEVNLVRRILTSEEVATAAKNTNNAELITELKLWLSDAAVGELPAQSAVEKTLSWVRVGFTKSKLAFNVYVTALQLTGIFQSMAVIGTKNYARGAAKFLRNPVNNYKAVMERSAFMNARYGILQTFDKDVQDANDFLNSMFGPSPTKLKGAMSKVGKHYFWPIAKMQSVVDVTTWMGAYEKGLNEKSLGEEDAVLYADTQVEASQTSGLFSDRSGIERGTLGTRTRQGQFVRLWTTLISYMLAKGNIAYEKGVAFKKKPSLEAAMYLATDYIMLFMIEGMASSLIYNKWPGDEDEDEGVVGWVAKNTVDSMISGVPLIREITSAKYGSGTTPAGAFVVDFYKFTQQMGQGELDAPLVKSGVKVFGTLFHLPASQTNRAVEAMMSDDDSELYEYITGKRDR